MKKFVNDPAKFVPEFMKGIALANPDLLDFNAEFQMITRKSGPDNARSRSSRARARATSRRT
jgi:dihydroxyacetone kinase-like protein